MLLLQEEGENPTNGHRALTCRKKCKLDRHQFFCLWGVICNLERSFRGLHCLEESTCCVKFNDLFLNYTITSDLSQCAPPSAQEESGTSFTVRIQVENPSSLEQISLQSYEASVIAALGNVTANVTVAPRSAVQLSPDFQGSWASLLYFGAKCRQTQ